jgi:signal transduction histidine kinase
MSIPTSTASKRIQEADIGGSLVNSAIRRTVKRSQFTLIAAAGAIGLLSLIAFAIFDSVSSVHEDTQRVQQSTLSAELSSFVLSLRDQDGTSLLDNPREFAAAQRPLQPVSLRRSFYTYLLNRGNARNFTVDKVAFEPPRSCTLLFEAVAHAKERLQACFAVVPDDPAGRYIYFILRYPDQRLEEHGKGAALANSNRVEMDLIGERPLGLTLVFEPPVLASARYPSQMKRFSGLHEVSAFLGGSRPTRQVNAQAYERAGEGAEGRNLVTVVGRIDAGLIGLGETSAASWPTAAAKKLKVGLQIYSSDTRRGIPVLTYDVKAGAAGEALSSLQKAYLASVPSGARIDIVKSPKGDLTWSTSELSLPENSRRRDWTQRLSDWWAPRLMSLLGKPYGGAPVRVQVEFGTATGPLMAQAVSEPAPLPDVATRAFGWLTAALLLTFVLVVIGVVAVVRLLKVTRSAWAAAVSLNQPHKRPEYGRKRDEISTLGRVLNLLLVRSRTRNRNLVKRVARERSALMLDQELLQLRHDRLDAIGHEIRSPLQALLIRTKGDTTLQGHLQRMERAVEALIDAESVEDGIGGLEIVLNDVDVSAYLARLVDAKKNQHPYLRYEGPLSGVQAVLDAIQFEQVIDHLIDNARRYRNPEGAVVVRLRQETEVVVVEVFDEGKWIAEERLDEIFKYRDSDHMEPANRGLGLFAARSYLLAMKATIRAENQPGGVAMVIRLQRVGVPVRA